MAPVNTNKFTPGTPVIGVNLTGRLYHGIFLEFDHHNGDHAYFTVVVTDPGNIAYGHKHLRELRVDPDAAWELVKSLREALPKYVVHWSNGQGYEGHGSPIARDLAESTVKHCNKTHPTVRHWIECWEPYGNESEITTSSSDQGRQAGEGLRPALTLVVEDES